MKGTCPTKDSKGLSTASYISYRYTNGRLNPATRVSRQTTAYIFTVWWFCRKYVSRVWERCNNAFAHNDQLQLGGHTKHFEVSIMVNRGDITITLDPTNNSSEFNKNAISRGGLTVGVWLWTLSINIGRGDLLGRFSSLWGVTGLGSVRIGAERTYLANPLRYSRT